MTRVTSPFSAKNRRFQHSSRAQSLRSSLHDLHTSLEVLRASADSRSLSSLSFSLVTLSAPSPPHNVRMSRVSSDESDPALLWIESLVGSAVFDLTSVFGSADWLGNQTPPDIMCEYVIFSKVHMHQPTVADTSTRQANFLQLCRQHALRCQFEFPDSSGRSDLC